MRRFPLSLVVLAGGSSRRMKTDKALLPVPRGTLIEHILHQLERFFQETLISVSDPRKFTFLDRRLVVDPEPGLGPLMGIKTALAASKSEKNFVIACDIPAIDFEFLNQLICAGKSNEIAVSQSTDGRVEPLFAVYSKSTVPRMEQLLNSGIHSILPLLDVCRTQHVRMSSASWFKNLNTLHQRSLSQIEVISVI